MIIRINPIRTAGNTLLVSLMTCAILGVLLASYLTMVQTQSISVMRSQVWNATLVLTEAGVEEALSQMNRNAPFFDPTEATNNLSANYWYREGNTYRAPRRYLGRSYYDVAITMNGLEPIIDASGVAFPKDIGSAESGTVFASIGSDWQTAVQKRAVHVNTRIDPLFAVAMAALETIDFSGNNVSTDSFDSSDPAFSNNGLYPLGQPTKIKANGDVCTDLSIIDSIDIGNANINGKAKTGPNGSVHVGKNGYVSGGVSDDFNVVFPPVTAPEVSWLPAPSGTWTIDGVSYKNKFDYSGDYYLTGLSGSLYVSSNLSVRLKVTGNVKLTGNSDQIRVAPGARLILYMTAPSFSIKGQGVVNQSGKAANFCYYGTTNNTTVSFGGNAAFTGVIYAPNAAFSLGGGGNNAYDFVGASVTKTVKMNGHFNFHYDEALRRWGPARGFVPTNWEER